MKLNKKSFFASLLLLTFILLPVSSVLATEYSDNFDTDPFSSNRWSQGRGLSVWDSVNGEMDMGDNQARVGTRYIANNPGSIEHEAQATFQHTNQFGENTQGGPGVRFKNDGTSDWYWVTVNASNDTYTLFRNLDGASTQLAQGSLAINSGDFLTIRLSAQGGVGSNVNLSVWITNHGASKPTDPGWIGTDNSPNLIYTDSDANRLDDAVHIQTGIAGEATGLSTDSRHDYFKARAISDRSGSATPPVVVSDTTPPTVSSISVSNITTSGATITYTTNESVTSNVQYGLTTAYGSTASSGGTTSHSVTLSNLNSNTTYNYRISASDSSGNNTLSSNATFTTTQIVVTPPVTTPSTPPASGTFDSSDYRQNTYGVPNRYADPTKSLSVNGSGTLSDPWNLNQAMALAVAGDVVGILPGVSVRMPSSNNGRFPTFRPTNSGTANNRIVFVTKYAAVGLSNVATNPNRTQLRHDGTRATANGDYENGTGSPMIGTYFTNYATFDGFYIDMAEAQPRGDSGVLRVENATGVHFRNFEVKGTRTNMQSNPIIYRPNYAQDTVLSNFRAYDFSNDRTNSTTPQGALFSDQYGDQNVLMEHFEIRNTERGIFFKGTANYANLRFNSGTIRYGIVSNVSSCYQFNDLDPSILTTVEYNVCYDVSDGAGIRLSSETSPARNILIHHNTVARVNSASANTEGTIMSRANGISSNVNIRDNIFDLDNGVFGHGVSFGEIASLPATLNYNAYTKNGGTLTWAYNNAQQNSLSAWRTATNRDLNSQGLSSASFVNRSGADFRTQAGSALKTMSSTGGEVGAYAGSEYPGVVMPTGAYPSGTTTPPPANPVPTADIRANSSNTNISVTTGTSVSISWTTTNTTTCSVTPNGFTGTSGAQTVTPTVNTTYTLTCSGSGGSASDSITVSVSPVSTPVIPPTPTQGSGTTSTTTTTTTPPTNSTSTPVSTTIAVGDRVQTTARVNVRSTPAGKRLGTQSSGAQGVVVTGPSMLSGYSWYRINFTTGVDGWTRSDFLKKVSTTTLSSDEIRNSIANILLLIKQLQAQLDALKGR